MGRIAGPLSRRQLMMEWKRRMEEERYARSIAPPAPMLAVPHARRRQRGLLWVIAELFPEGLVVGAKGMPPLTDDMRVLLARKLLRQFRKHSWGIGNNTLMITEEGRALLRDSPPDPHSIDYVVNAFRSASLR